MVEELKELKKAAKKEMDEAVDAKRKYEAAEKLQAERRKRIEAGIEDSGLDAIVETQGAGSKCAEGMKGCAPNVKLPLPDVKLPSMPSMHTMALKSKSKACIIM